MTSPVFLHRVRLRNYRSIGTCDVELGQLTLLVGPNGSGKSNFVDALRFVAESLRTSVEHALRERGGVEEVRRRSAGHPTHFAIRLEVTVDGLRGFYAFEIGAVKGGGFKVKREQCDLGGHRFDVREGTLLVAPWKNELPATSDRLFLVTASVFQPFRALYDLLSNMGFYNIEPERIRELQAPDEGLLLRRDGGNLASVARRMASGAPESMNRVLEFLKEVVPGIEGFSSQPMGHMQTLEFRQRVEGAGEPWRFPAITMSDGTLRAAAILVALFQPAIRAVPLVAIEEPETALHPAASGVLFDALRAATRHTQVLVTSHSPELLDHPSLDPAEIRAVVAEQGRTEIGVLDAASRSAMRDHLYSGGELLRAGQLEPELLENPARGSLFARWARP